MPPPTHDSPSSQWWHPKRDRRYESNKLCNTHRDISKESPGAKSKDGTCEGCAEKEYVCCSKLEPSRHTDCPSQLLEKRAAKEAMDAKREKMSSYDIWMEAARGKRKKSDSRNTAA